MDYKKVIEDFNNGTIDPEKWQLCMENDDGYWSYLEGDDLPYEELEKIRKDMTEKYGGRPDGYSDVVKILVAAGVNADWC